MSRPTNRASSHDLKLVKTWYACGALMLGIVAVLSLMPAPQSGVNDKLAHLLTYFLLGAWFALIARNRVVLGWSLLGLIGYGMLIELLQARTGYRYAEWGDVFANTCGCVAGSLLFFTPLRQLARLIDQWLAALLARIIHRLG